MSKIVGVTLLLIILVDSFYESTAVSVGFRLSKKHILKCRCRVSPNGKIKCRSLRLPTNHEDLIKCLCSKTNQHTFPELQAACTSWRPGFPISLV